MPILNNPRHERFAQLVATGQSAAQAYTAVGYEEKSSYTCGPRLLKRAEIRARADELRQTVARSAVDAAALNRQFVLTELMDNAIKAKENQEWSASNRALELLGKELGLFVDRSEHTFWNGDPNTLSDEQLNRLIQYFEEIVHAERKLKLSAAGQVLDIAPEAGSLGPANCETESTTGAIASVQGEEPRNADGISTSDQQDSQAIS